MYLRQYPVLHGLQVSDGGQLLLACLVLTLAAHRQRTPARRQPA